MMARAQNETYSAADELCNALERDVERALGDLPTVELQVLRLRFGIGTRHRSQRDIAQRLGISISRVRRMERRALRDLRALALPSDLLRRPAATRTRRRARDHHQLHVETAPRD